MRLGPLVAAAALAALLAGCSKSQSTSSSETAPAAPAATAMSDTDLKAAQANLPEPYKSADITNGESKFALCQSCHTVAQGGANMTGPNLYGVIGTQAAAPRGDFKFSDALKAANITWTPDKIDTWITKPQAMVPGTKMSFAGLNDPKDRTDLIAYLMVATGYKP